MACYSPLHGWRSRVVGESGKRAVVFNASEGYRDMPVTVPCGQCVGCRLERSRQWAMRCVHEASLYEENCFITLTYNDENLPLSGSLVLEDFQKFMKRLRKKYGNGIRFFHCGEYGESFKRPHYHACLFNFDFPDKKIWSERFGNKLYISESLDLLWNKGYCIIGDVSFDSAAYVARYIMKKINGSDAKGHYKGLRPEYVTMSRRPGIAREWFARFKKDVFPSDVVVLKGREMRPPKYYDNIFDLTNPEEFFKVKCKRKKVAQALEADNTIDRLEVKEKCCKARLNLFKKRSYEE